MHKHSFPADSGDFNNGWFCSSITPSRPQEVGEMGSFFKKARWTAFPRPIVQATLHKEKPNRSDLKN